MDWEKIRERDKKEKDKYVLVPKMKLITWMETCGVIGFALGLLAARSIWGLWHVVIG